MTRTEIGCGSQYRVLKTDRFPGIVIKVPTFSYWIATRALGIDLSIRGKKEIEIVNEYFGDYALTTRQLTTSKRGVPIYIQTKMINSIPLTQDSIKTIDDKNEVLVLMEQLKKMQDETGFILDLFGFYNLLALSISYSKNEKYWAIPNLNFGQDGKLKNRILISDFGLFQTRPGSGSILDKKASKLLTPLTNKTLSRLHI